MNEPVDFSAITACGEDCTGCAKRLAGLCGGCVEMDGHCQEWAESGCCPEHACVREHDALFCGLCSCFPCGDLPRLMPWKPDAQNRLSALAEAYRRRQAALADDGPHGDHAC